MEKITLLNQDHLAVRMAVLEDKGQIPPVKIIGCTYTLNLYRPEAQKDQTNPYTAVALQGEINKYKKEDELPYSFKDIPDTLIKKIRQDKEKTLKIPVFLILPDGTILNESDQPIEFITLNSQEEFNAKIDLIFEENLAKIADVTQRNALYNDIKKTFKKSVDDILKEYDLKNVEKPFSTDEFIRKLNEIEDFDPMDKLDAIQQYVQGHWNDALLYLEEE